MMNPNLAVLPDFASPQFEENRTILKDVGLNEQQAIETLTRQWTIANNKEKVEWNRHRDEQAAAEEEDRQCKEELEAQHQEEDAQALKEEWKKNKAKFTPIPKVPVPSDPIILPSQVAIQKIREHKFCELWYFTNAGLDVADRAVNHIPYKPYVQYRHTGAIWYRQLLSNLTTVTVSGW